MIVLDVFLHMSQLEQSNLALTLTGKSGMHTGIPLLY